MPKTAGSKKTELASEKATGELLRRKSRSRLPPLFKTHPELALQWHRIYNKGITPEDLTRGSNFEAWWVCPRGADHIFQMVIAVRAASTAEHKACPFCRGDIESIVKPLRRKGRKFKTSIIDTHLTIASQWDFEKNDWWLPEDFTAGSSFKAWWICPIGHKFEKSIGSRTGTRCLSLGCPDCGKLAKFAYARDPRPLSITHPELAEQWDHETNGALTPDNVRQGSNKRVWWICPHGPDHMFQSPISRRSRSANNTMACPFCAGKKPSVTNCLASKYPELLPEFSIKNKIDPTDIVANTGVKYLWVCSKCSNEWMACPGFRGSLGTGCPKCERGDTVNISKNKTLMAMFDHKKNRNIDPKAISVGTKIWWRCSVAKDHVFEMGVYRGRTKQKCPFCRQHKTSVTNSLAANYKELAKQWHPDLNGDLTPKAVRFTSNQKVWWKCKLGTDHQWPAMIWTRVKGMGCPYCKNRRPSVTNNLSVTHPEIAREFHPKKNGEIKVTQVLPGSTKEYWWLCARGHSYSMMAYVRTGKGGNCKKCRELRST